MGTIAIAVSSTIEWSVLVLLAIVVLTAVLSISLNTAFAVAHDALPYLLVLGWIVLILAVIDGAWWRAGAAAALVAYHLYLIVPRFVSHGTPRWATNAATIRLVVSNVYVDNPTPDRLVAELLAADGDIMICAEWNERFAAAFDAADAGAIYPHQLLDEHDHSEYAVCIASKVPLHERSAFVEVGSLKMAHAFVPCGERMLSVIGIIPSAVVDPGGFSLWKTQISALAEHIPSLDIPIVLAGDFNTTRFRPEFRALLKAGLVDAHDSLGRGLSSSFRLSTDGVLSTPGTVIRLDHALLSKEVCAMEVTDLDSAGSDHLPFCVTLAVRQRQRRSARAAGPQYASATVLADDVSGTS
ncbi:MAG: endonuclease/exonuclease/phosphatase family protein [Ilumatobacteraceae bacterium]